MILVYNNIIPFHGYMCINICGILFIRNEYKDRINLIIINHELIHTKLIFELGIIGFYIWYLIEWIIKLCKYKIFHSAYLNIGFEKEASIYEEDFGYIKRRKHYSWIGMI